MFDMNTVLSLLENFMKFNPAGAIRVLILASPIRTYLEKTLPKESILWLAEDIKNKPTGFVDFINSDRGKNLTREVFLVYYKSLQPAQLASPTVLPSLPRDRSQACEPIQYQEEELV
jgi:hypothetical protein